ncbi:MAG: plasma-membrane choline transporter-domain-containing protein [Benjaminiella poitrasii]|nr:MAG: plasma-membrane choline transporter-domain-containing protein [Benjaminiella poitrasii]
MTSPYSQQYPPLPQQYALPPEDHSLPTPQPYYQQPPAYNATTGYAVLGEFPSVNDKIKPSSGYKDVWATILWLCNLIGFIVLSVLAIRYLVAGQGIVESTLDMDTVRIFGYAAIIGFGLSFIYLITAHIIPGPLIVITFVASILVYIAATVYYFYMKYYPAAVVFLIFTVLYLICFWTWRDRIPFATVMLKTIIKISRRYWSTLITSLISLVVQTIFTIWFMFTVVGAYQLYINSQGRLTAAMIFLVFSFYWTTQVISYVTHVTLSGVFATVYFLNDQTSRPIWGSARRALTTSFGSICFGSLLVAVLETLRYLAQVGRSGTDNDVLGFVLCLIECFVGCIESFFEWFNQYAFSGVAIYGQGFVPTAKRTWALIQDRGIEALINDNLIGNVLAMGALLVGILTSLLGYLYLFIVKPEYSEGGGSQGMTAVVMLVCFIIGMSIFSVVSVVISSGVTTFFVCLAEDPEALQRVNPNLYEAIRQTWPEVVQGI